jgi:O-antigen ligase
MLTQSSTNRSSRLVIGIAAIGIGGGLIAGVLAGYQPLILGLLLLAIVIIASLFAQFERVVLGLLILRSSLDVFSEQQIPAAFAIALDALTLLYVTVMLLTKRRVYIDRYWWFFAGWVAVQALWLVLMPLGALGLDASYLTTSLREWVRLFSWLMVYLLVMQLKDRITPEKFVATLSWALAIPAAIALMQIFVPALLPPILSSGGNGLNELFAEGESRIRGTLGHPNTFATFLLLFIGLTWWRLGRAKKRLPLLLLLGLLAFLYVATKALFSLVMLAVFVLVLVAPRISTIKLIGGILLLLLVMGLFVSTEFGQQRLGSLANTPLLNPDMDVSRAILLSQGDNNSFNWRLAQWTYLLQAWEQSPVFGYGLGTSMYLTSLKAYAHNDYIRALAEGGVIGLVVFVVFLGAQITRLVQLFRQSPQGSSRQDFCLVLLAVLLATMVGMVTENIWSHTTFYFYWSALLAIAGWPWDSKKHLAELEIANDNHRVGYFPNSERPPTHEANNN